MVPFARKRFDTTFKTIKKRNSLQQQGIESQDHQTCDTEEGESEGEGEFEVALKDFMQMRVLDTVYEEDERSWASPEKIAECEQAQSNTGQSTHFKQLLESTPNHLVQSRSFRKIEKTSAKENALSFIRGFTKFTLFPVSTLLEWTR